MDLVVSRLCWGGDRGVFTRDLFTRKNGQLAPDGSFHTLASEASLSIQ